MSRERTDHGPEAANRMENDGKMEMARKALEKMKEEMDKSKKLNRDYDTQQHNPENKRKLDN